MKSEVQTVTAKKLVYNSHFNDSRGTEKRETAKAEKRTVTVGSMKSVIVNIY